jgi:TRAP-type uncharacterized transport system substrate-binding protein
MVLEYLALLSRLGRFSVAVVIFALMFGAVWAVAHFLKPAPPRHIVLASGPEDGTASRYAKRYIDILARAGITVEERITHGGAENLRLLEDPHSGVDIAFTSGGIATYPDANDVVMIANLGYLPMWIFYRGPNTLNYISELRSRRVAIGAEGSSTRTLVDSVLAINDLTSDDLTIVPLMDSAALRALKSGEVDAAVVLDFENSRTTSTALNDPDSRLMSIGHADAYPRLLPYISKLTLPSGVINLAHNIPEKEVSLIGTKEMLVARDGLHPALVALLFDASREIFGGQTLFAEAGDFPATTRVDLRVSTDADRHNRFGSSWLYQYLPFWVATLAERAIIIVLPLAAVVFPLFHYLPQLLRWHVRSRVYRWYGELALLERDVATRTGTLPSEKWLADLDRIERAAARLRIPDAFASEAYTLRGHIDWVRSALIGRIGSPPIAAR